MPPKSTAQKRKATDILARIVKQAQTARIELTPLVLQCDDEEQLFALVAKTDSRFLDMNLNTVLSGAFFKYSPNAIPPMVSTHDWILAVGNTSPPKSKTTNLTEAIMNHLPNGIVENAQHIELIEGLLSTALGDRVVFQKKPPKIIEEAATEAIVAQILARASWTKSP